MKASIRYLIKHHFNLNLVSYVIFCFGLIELFFFSSTNVEFNSFTQSTV